MSDTGHEPGTIRLDTLHQGEYWVNRHGKKILLDDMTESYLRNVLDFLVSKADALFDLELAADLVRAPGCSWASDDAGYAGPLDVWSSTETWLAQTALVNAIRDRLTEASPRPVIASGGGLQSMSGTGPLTDAGIVCAVKARAVNTFRREMYDRGIPTSLQPTHESMEAALASVLPLIRPIIEAEALREFAEFLENPTEPGLDSFTLRQVAMEAQARADALLKPSQEGESDE